MPKKLACIMVVVVLMVACVPVHAEPLPKIALVPGGDPKPNELLVLTEAKLFENKEIELLDRTEIDKVLAEQKLSGMFSAENAVALGQILKTDMFAVLETTSVVIFDAKTGLRFVDETLPKTLEDAVNIAADAVKTAVEKQQKLADSTLVTFGVLEVRNADFSRDRDAWCRAVAGMLERSLLHRGGAVLERSRFQLVNRERQLPGDSTNKLLTSMKLIDIDFTRAETLQSFKMAARIGDETFRAESAFDKPLDAVQKLAEQLLESKNVTGTSLEAEAARFVAESRFVHEQKRYAEALENAETAFALHPDVKTYQERLIDALLFMSLESVCPGWGMNHSTTSNSYPNVTADQMRRSLEFVRRAVEIREKYSLYSTGQSYMASIRGHWKNILGYKYFSKELKTEIAEFNRRILDQWIEEVYKPVTQRFFTEEVNKKALDGFKEVLSVSMTYAVKNQADADAAACFEMLTNDIFRAKFEWQHTGSAGDMLRILFRELIAFAAEYRDQPPENRNPMVDAALERIAVTIENDPRFIVQIHSWLVRNKLFLFRSNDLPLISTEAVNAYVFRLEEKIQSLPPDLSPTEYSILYDEMSHTLLFWCKEDKYHRAVEMLEIANARNEFARALTGWCLSEMIREGESITGDLSARLSSSLTGQIEIGMKVAPDQTKPLALRAIAAGICVSPSAPAKLWKKEIVLLEPPKEKSFAVYRRPFFHNDQIYLFMTESPTMRLIIIDLKTLERREYSGVQKWNRAGSAKNDVSYVDDANAYYGTQSLGVFVFPLNGSEPWSLGPKEGLPNGAVHGLGSMHDKLYVGLEDSQERSWLIAIDLKKRDWETLAASSAKEGKTPFVNMTPGPKFRAFFEDVERDQLFMFVDGIFVNRHEEQHQKLRGFWSIDGKTQELTQLKPFVSRMSGLLPGHTPVGEHRVLFLDLQGHVMLFDLHKTDGDHACEYLCHNPNRPWDAENNRWKKTDIHESRLHQGTLFHGYLWGALSEENKQFVLSGGTFASNGTNFWARVAADGKSEAELLAVPESIGTPGWTPSAICRATSDGKNLIVGDGYSLILLRFDDDFLLPHVPH